MKPKQVGIGISLSAEDINAIVCALPLVANAVADSPEQTELNRICCTTAAEKLVNRCSVFSANEIRVIDVAIEFALLYLGGSSTPFVSVLDVDPEWRKDLSRYLFTYTKLKPHFNRLVDQYEKLC